MAWDDDAPTILRVLLQDTADVPKYDDDRLAEMFLVTARLIQTQVRFPNAYVVSIGNGTISPDPSLDADFMNLTALRAALNLTQAEIREMTRQGIEIQDGDSRIKLGRSSESLKLMLRSYSDQYEQALLDFQAGRSVQVSQAIVSPYRLFSGTGPGAYELGDGRSYRSGY